MDEARSFYFDIALSGNEYTLPLLMRFAKKGHVLFGSDFPFAPTETIGVMTGAWERFAEAMGGEERWGVERGNAEKLFPRLKGEGEEGREDEGRGDEGREDKGGEGEGREDEGEEDEGRVNGGGQVD